MLDGTHGRSDREDAAHPPAALGPTGWLGCAEAAPADCSRVPARARLPAVPPDQRGLDRAEPPTADTVVNVDLPWNPAILEQRIGRVHRMGQTRPVHAFVLITERTIEENLLGALSAERELAIAALDPDSDVDRVDLAGGMDELKRRLEILLGAKPEAPVDESEC